MNFFARLSLRHKLRVVTASVIVCSMIGSVLAFLEMREASEVSEDVALHQIPTREAMRDLRVGAISSSAALRGYLLFGTDSSAAAHYRTQFEQSEQLADESTARIAEMRRSSTDTSASASIAAAVNAWHTLDADHQQVLASAFGHGNASTAQAHALLQGVADQHYDQLCALLVDSIQQVSVQLNNSLDEELHLNRMVVAFMAGGLLFGALIGFITAEITGRRIVRPIIELATRAHAIAEGDLTGAAVEVTTQDELGDLAQSIAAMQESLQSMVGAMMDGSSDVHRNAAGLACSAAESFNRSKEQGLQIHQAATAMQEMSISVAEVSNHAQNAADQARQAATIAREGGAIVEEMLAGMSSISESVSQSTETVQSLGHESEQIIRIVNVIEEIAQKTNLLALNAAIEAARAGEQGRGFAVVAGEVRRLAESTRNATSEIAQMIQGIQSHTHQAVEAMGSGTERVSHGMEVTARAGESLRRIMTAADQVDAMIAQIATAATEQSVAAQQFSQNLEVINRISEEHAAATPVTKGFIDAVESGSIRLNEYVGRFRVGEQSIALRPASEHRSATQPTHAFGD
ncbi:MAG TPA: methyl-accepting chemotaxis protein [Acidobacteriaceae bacterium]|jgi:methyl-accepting chemotaxis protein|nr:methyl-accepting chemotaxis protein [Acidobacteriaceae bacterium]